MRYDSKNLRGLLNAGNVFLPDLLSLPKKQIKIKNSTMMSQIKILEHVTFHLCGRN